MLRALSLESEWSEKEESEQMVKEINGNELLMNLKDLIHWTLMSCFEEDRTIEFFTLTQC